MKENDTVTTCLGIIFGLIATLVVGTLMDGWALSKIWNWFMPTIFSLPVLTLWKAIGVSMVFELFSRTNKSKKSDSKSNEKTIGEAILASIIEVTVVPLTSVGIAWVVLQFAF